MSGNSRKHKLKVAFQDAKGQHVHFLPCGAFGTLRNLFHLAKARGFDGSEAAIWKRLEMGGGKLTLEELSKPTNKALITTKKRVQSSEVLEAIRSLDARKAAMR